MNNFISKSRGSIEWLNFWMEEPKESDGCRILLIGDSTARQYRSNLNTLVSPFASVDFFGSSSHLMDSRFHKEIECYFNICECSYDLIVVNIGGHHGLTLPENEFFSYEKYECCYKFFIDSLKTKAKNIIVSTCTHLVSKEDYSQLDYKLNSDIEKRNDIVKKTAEEYGFHVIDLYSYMLNEGKSYVHVDPFHFESSSDDFIAEKVLKEINEYCRLIEGQNKLKNKLFTPFLK